VGSSMPVASLSSFTRDNLLLFNSFVCHLICSSVFVVTSCYMARAMNEKSATDGVCRCRVRGQCHGHTEPALARRASPARTTGGIHKRGFKRKSSLPRNRNSCGTVHILSRTITRRMCSRLGCDCRRRLLPSAQSIGGRTLSARHPGCAPQ
jgi:hypothetical protein